MSKTILIAATLLASSGHASAAPETFAIDPGHTVVTFEALHSGMSTHRGHFAAKEGSVVLDRAASLVRPGGRLVYVTCSVLPRENDAAVDAVVARHPGFTVVDPAALARDADLPGLQDMRSAGGRGLQLTPLRSGTDGFFVAALRRR